MSDVLAVVYYHAIEDREAKYCLLRWPVFKEAVLGSGLIGTHATARAKWFKLATIPEIFCKQSTDSFAVDVPSLRAVVTHTHTKEEAIRW